ncbi:hypothetical protein [Enterobacter cloacae]|uniref:hypothetical protein n=1 Tax=Enterobacter cloacae TaxID=550 RepID=UPI00388FC6E5
MPNRFLKLKILITRLSIRILIPLNRAGLRRQHLIDAWFNQLKAHFKEYGSDAKLGVLLGLQGRSADRRIRAYRNGAEIIPYGIWRTFLELTGRVVVDVKSLFWDCLTLNPDA